MMSRKSPILAFAFAVVAFPSLAILEASDTKLTATTMAVSFGGNTVPNNLCCRQIAACNVTGQSCRDKSNTDSATCTGYSQLTIQNTYAKNCQQPNPPVPKASCTDFETDSTGRKYRCVAAFNCSWDSITKVCDKGAANDNKAVFGYYDCGSNCN